MNPIVKNILAVVVGWLVGSAVNMGLITVGSNLFPIAGVASDDMAALAEAMPNLSAEHFIFPFLAHAVGTMVGAAVAAYIAANNKMKFALGIGVLFLLGGIAINMMLPGPTWFTALDLLVAYIPMAWLGGSFGINMAGKRA